MPSHVCKAGHTLVCELDSHVELTGRKRPHKKLLCDECKRIAVVSEFVGCRECNYDVCNKCLTQQSIARYNVPELFGPTLHSKDRSETPISSLAGKTIGVLFWSHTCDICTGYTAALRRFYEELREVTPGFEIVAVTDTADDCDEDEKEMWAAYQGHGDWLTVPFDAEEHRHALHDWAEVVTGDHPSGSGPLLIIIADGKVINKRATLLPGCGVQHVVDHAWASPSIGDLSRGPTATDSDLGCTKGLVFLLENCSRNVVSNVTAAVTNVLPFLKEYDVIPFVTSISGVAKGRRPDITSSLTEGCAAWGRGWSARALRKWGAKSSSRVKTVDTVPLMLLVDVSEFTEEEDRGLFVSDATLITPDRIRAFIKDNVDGKIPRHTIEYDNFTEDFKPLAEDDVVGPAYQPLQGMVSADGNNYIGAVGGWDGFGIEGITGSFDFMPKEANATEDPGEDSDTESSEAVDVGPTGGGNLLSQMQSLGDEGIYEETPDEPKKFCRKRKVKVVMTHEKLCETVMRLEKQVAEQNVVIQQLVQALQGNTSPSSIRYEPTKFPATPLPGQAPRGVWKSESSSESDVTPGKKKAKSTKKKEKKVAGLAPPSTTPPPAEEKKEWKCEDDSATDSDDSEVREYRAKQAAKKAGGVPSPVPAPAAAADDVPEEKRKWKCESDSATDSDDSEVREYRAKQAAKKAGAAAKAGTAAPIAPPAEEKKEEKKEWKCEDDSATDSDDSEVREYRAKQAAKKAAAAAKTAGANNTPADATPAANTVQNDDKKEDKTPEKKSAQPADEDWHCGKCHEFNWADASKCTHCEWKRA